MTHPAGSSLPELEHLKTVRQLCETHPHLFSEGSLRWLIFNAKTNGFDACIIRMGRRLFIDITALRAWLATNRGVTLDSADATAARIETAHRRRTSPKARKTRSGAR